MEQNMPIVETTTLITITYLHSENYFFQQVLKG